VSFVGPVHQAFAAGEPERWIVRIEWDSIDGHKQGFQPSPAFGAFLDAIRPFFGQHDEAQHYQPK
jgi:hypothetical protein